MQTSAGRSLLEIKQIAPTVIEAEESLSRWREDSIFVQSYLGNRYIFVPWRRL